MEKTITQDVTLVTDTCCSCGVLHAIPKGMRDKAYRDGGYWYCPNGHHIGWDKGNCKSAVDKLKEDVAYFQNRVDEVSRERDHTKLRLAAQKGETTKLKKRVSNGVCPCCNRHFTNVQRHIKTKHPAFAETE